MRYRVGRAKLPSETRANRTLRLTRALRWIVFPAGAWKTIHVNQKLVRHASRDGLSLQTSTSVDGSAPSATADLQFDPACNGGVNVIQFSFNPETVNPGQTSPATLVLQNCTSQTVTGANRLVWPIHLVH